MSDGKFSFLRRNAVALAVTAAAAAILALGLASASGETMQAGLELTEKSLRRAVATCYSIEGAYPESVEYLEQNYGFSYDKSAYSIGYSAFASNIFPDITVLAAGTGEAQ